MVKRIHTRSSLTAVLDNSGAARAWTIYQLSPFTGIMAGLTPTLLASRSRNLCGTIAQPVRLSWHNETLIQHLLSPFLFKDALPAEGHVLPGRSPAFCGAFVWRKDPKRLCSFPVRWMITPQSTWLLGNWSWESRPADSTARSSQPVPTVALWLGRAEIL